MGRSPCACCRDVYFNKGPWTPAEDALLTDYVKLHGEGNWSKVPKASGLQRCGKSCRLRWLNHLRPDIKRGKFSEDEMDLIIQLHALLGNRWSLIAGRIPGRSDNEIKNYWNFYLSKKLLSMGIDPKSHKPVKFGILRKVHDAGDYQNCSPDSGPEQLAADSTNYNINFSLSPARSDTSLEDNRSCNLSQSQLNSASEVSLFQDYILDQQFPPYEFGEQQQPQQQGCMMEEQFLDFDFLEGPFLGSEGLLEILEGV